jgi:hypothetical protein
MSLYTNIAQWGVRASAPLALSILLPIILAGTAMGAGSRTANITKLSEILRDIYVTPVTISVAGGDRARVALKVRALQPNELKSINKRAGLFPSKGSRTKSYCLYHGTEGQQTRTARLFLTTNERLVMARFLPATVGAGNPVMAINLKAAGLTKKSQYMPLRAAAIRTQPKGNKAIIEILSMARTGSVRLRATLKNKPSDDRQEQALATVQTDKGPLRLWVLKPSNNTGAQSNAVVFKTPRGNTFEVPLTQFPDYREVRRNLSIHGLMRRTRSLRLSVSGSTPEFVIEYATRPQDLSALTVEFATLPLDDAKRALGQPVTSKWTASVTVQKVIAAECDVIIKQAQPVGTTFYGAAFNTFYQGDRSRITSVLTYDPASREPGFVYSKDSAPASDGEVK